MVPGCGTGRLMYDVAVLGHDVEANDFDVMKLAAANAVVSGYGCCCWYGEGLSLVMIVGLVR